MIRRVRRQFICITMAMLTAVLLVPLIALNVVTEAMSYNQTRNLLEQIAISETTVPELPDDMRRTENSPGSPRILPRRPALPLRKRLQRLPRKPQPRRPLPQRQRQKLRLRNSPKIRCRPRRRRCSLRYRLPQRHEPLPHRRHGQPLRQEPPAHGRQSLR